MDGFGRFYHLSPSWLYGQVSSYSNYGNIINPVQSSNYLVYPHLYQPQGVPLAERKVSIINSPVISGMHSSQVYNLLIERAVQEQHFLTTKIMESYLRGVMAFAGHQTALLSYLENGGQRPVCTGYDLVCAGETPVSLYHSRSLPREHTHHLITHLRSMPAGTMPGIRQCLDVNREQKDFYENQLRLNAQQLAFNGYSCPAHRKTSPMAYPLPDVINHLGWIKNSGPRPAKHLQAYPCENHRVRGGGPTGIYFTPSKEPAVFYKGVDSNKTYSVTHKASTQRSPERARFPESPQQFEYPAKSLATELEPTSPVQTRSCIRYPVDILDNSVSQSLSKGREAIKRQAAPLEKEALLKPPGATTEKNASKDAGKSHSVRSKLEMTEVSDRPTINEASRKRKAINSEPPKPVKEAARKRKTVKPPKNVILASPEELQKKDQQIIQAGPLGLATKMLKGVSGADSRKLLDRLFNSYGRQLFINNQLPVDKEQTLEFIRFYKVAIQHELKKGKMGNLGQQQKKQERLEALNHIERFVEGLDDNNPNLIPLCRLAVQWSGRVRERSTVSQREIPFCGGFSVEQIAWGQQPLKVARAMIELAVNYQVTLPDGERTISIPDNIDLSKGHEPLADKLFLSAIYALNGAEGSIAYTDAVNIKLFGLTAKMYCPLEKEENSKNDEYDRKFLEDLASASEKKCPIRGAVDSIFAAFLNDKAKNQSYFRKRPNSVTNIDDEFREFNGTKGVGHAVIFDSFKIKGDQVEFKLYSWGKVFNWSMNKATFLKHVNKSNFLIVGDNGIKACFKKIEKEHFTHINGRAAACDDQGNIEYLKIGQIVTTPHYRTAIGCNHSGIIVAKTDENLVLVDALNHIVSIKKGEVETVAKLSDGRMILVDKNGQYKPMTSGEVVVGYHNSQYYIEGKKYYKLNVDKEKYFLDGKRMLVVENHRPIILGIGERHSMADGTVITYKGGSEYDTKKK